MEIYIFAYEMEKRGVADQQIFKDAEKAREAADYYYNHLTAAEKQDLLYCRVYAATVEPEDLEEIQENGISGDLEMRIWDRDIWQM